ncbi:hypothetical protein AAW14_08350 [Streptomyces hygroscopicus]|nr:hypothetical protein [Streptomyces hygroscopicus]
MLRLTRGRAQPVPSKVSVNVTRSPTTGFSASCRTRTYSPLPNGTSRTRSAVHDSQARAPGFRVSNTNRPPSARASLTATRQTLNSSSVTST